MDLDEIDGLLQRYAASESRIGANLHELDNHSTYQILRTDALRGQTAAKLTPALGKAEALWQYFSRLQSVLTEARALRGSGKMRNEDRLKLETLLVSDSIVLATADVPLEERGLLDAAESEERITIEQLLSRMRLAYEPIRDGVAQVEEVLRSVLPRFGAAEKTLRRASDEAKLLGVSEPELSQALRQLERLRGLALDDPLAIEKDDGPDLDRQVRLAAARVAAMKKGRDRLQGDMGAIAGLVAEVRTLHARAEAARAEALQKITSPVGLVRVPDEAAIDGAGGLVEAADAILNDASGPWLQQRHLLDKWLERGRRLRDQLRRAEQANGFGLVQRDELRGLLRAYRAKMAGVGRSEDLVLREIADEAHNELYTAPTDLARADRLIQDLGLALSQGDKTR